MRAVLSVLGTSTAGPSEQPDEPSVSGDRMQVGHQSIKVRQKFKWTRSSVLDHAIVGTSDWPTHAGARNAALLDLTWARCDFDRELIDLRNPTITTPHKGRAIVPMNRTVKAALVEARNGALSDDVIEWAGDRVRSVKNGLRSAATRAGIAHVSPHILRHWAAVHMAEVGIPMEEIAQYLGHSDVNVTRQVYARFSPDYLRGAAAVLEYDE
jgi:integrase